MFQISLPRLLVSLSWLGVMWLLVGLLACHHPRRNNPFDPALTPAVELVAVTNDTTTGNVTLRWTPYKGDQPFVAYLVLRNEPDRKPETADSLTIIRDIAQTSFVDTTRQPNTAYVYWVSVVNTSGFKNPSPEWLVPAYPAGPVALLDVLVDEQTGKATVSWRRFQGGGFVAYRVERRRVDEEVFTELAKVETVADTVYTDPTLIPDVVFVYRIVVEAAGHEWLSNRSGRVSFSPAAVNLLTATPNPPAGTIQLTWTRSRYKGPYFEGYEIHRQAGEDDPVLTTRTAIEETTFVDRTSQANVPYLYRVDVRVSGRTPLVGNLRPSLLTLPSIVLSSVTPYSATASMTLKWTRYQGPRFKMYRVLRSTAIEASTAVTEIPNSAQTSFTDSGLVGNTEYVYKVVMITNRDEEVASNEQQGKLHRWVDAWPVEVNVNDYGRLYYEEPEDRIVLLLANPERVRLDLFDTEGHRLEEKVPFERLFAPIAQRSVATTLTPEGNRLLNLILSGVTYRLGLEVVNGQVSVSIASPVVWRRTRDKGSIWSSMVMTETGVLLLTDDGHWYAIRQGTDQRLSATTAFVSETRVWEGKFGGLDAQFTGVCLPQINEIHFDPSSVNRRHWGFNLYNRVSGQIGSGAREFIYPLSFDVAPDGRFFVLDSGNARIKVFNSTFSRESFRNQTTYLTQWGSKGVGEGQFNFGSGSVPEDFAGSVAVDSRGSIYVLDMGNRRIQKFAP